MKLFDRVLLTIYPLLLVFLSLIVVMTAAGWEKPLVYLESILHDPWIRVIIGVGAGIVLVAAIGLFFSNFSRNPVAQALIKENQFGKIQITLAALENMIIRAGLGVEGIREVKPRIRCLPSGIIINLNTMLTLDARAPEVAEKLQQVVKNYLEETAGVQAIEIGIRVESISKEAQSRVK